MNVLTGQEKFGANAEGSNSLLGNEKKGKKEDVPSEDSYLLNKTITCAVCDKTFKTKTPKNGRLRRLEPDEDLRPRFANIDVVKYDVVSCPYCGYTALSRYFDHLASTQMRLIREQICAEFTPKPVEPPQLLSYDDAIERYKVALRNTIVKKGKSSEKAYICLKTAWMYRSKIEELDEKSPDYEKVQKEYASQEEAFYGQAFEGFMKAVSTEPFPICGMDQCTMDYLLAVMAWHFRKKDIAAKCISRIQTNPGATRKMKDRTYDLKEKIISETRKNQ